MSVARDIGTYSWTYTCPLKFTTSSVVTVTQHLPTFYYSANEPGTRLIMLLFYDLEISGQTEQP